MRPPTRLAALAGIAALTAALAGCAPADHRLGPDATMTAPGTFGPTDDPVNEAVGINCQTLVTDQAVYDWGSGNFAIDVDYVPEAGSSAAQIAATGGLACSWVNLTSGETVDVAVAVPSAAELEAAHSIAAETGTPVPELGADAFFRVDEGVGHVDAFTDRYWITADSTWFSEQADAAPIMRAAVAALED